MFETAVSTEIVAPVDAVYRYLADFPRHAEWSSGVAELEPVTNGGTGVESDFKATETVPMKFTSYSHVTALEPPRRIAWDSWAPGMMQVAWAFEITPTAVGTHLVQRCCFQPQSLLATALLTLVRKWQIPRENRQSLERLKEILERDEGLRR